MSPTTVSVNVLSWNGRDWLRPCLDSVLASLDAPGLNGKVLVIDNASCDGTRLVLDAYKGRIETLLLSENHGFTGGHNRGIRRALQQGAEWVALLNQDVRVEKDWLLRLLEVAGKNPRAGILSPFQYDYDGLDLDPGFRRTLSLLPETAEGLISHRWNAPYYVSDMAAGAALLIHRRVFEKIGVFDPAYFSYHEESDLYRRAMAAGAEIVLVPKSRIFHWHTLRRRPLPAWLALINTRNYFRIILKNPNAPFAKNLLEAARTWWKCLRDSLTAKKHRRTALLLWTGLADLPPRIPFIYWRRAAERWMIRAAGNNFSNRGNP
ncbi:MAG TPA: glycosyltransferase family 2 protein [Elusimicrobiota bacterium]|nr:glycosyltransferase family 2 protein [Elusimicrobiota bacterium]